LKPNPKGKKVEERRRGVAVKKPTRRVVPGPDGSRSKMRCNHDTALQSLKSFEQAVKLWEGLEF
jgi:hypothetical protein